MPPTKRLTAPKLILALCVLALIYPVSMVIDAARADEDLRTALAFLLGMVALVTGIVCVIVISVGPSNLNGTGRRLNANGTEVLPIPPALALHLADRPGLVDAQARHGGIPVPISPELLQALVEVHAEFMRGPKTTAQEGEVATFMANVFRSASGEAS
jgi:hypothetical protein